MSNKPYFQIVTAGNEASLTIYGDITSFPWMEGDTSSAMLSKQLAELQNVARINVYINSYGGEVAEGLAIYNALKRHPAQIVTYCDGMSCSIASVIFMAGDERVMCNPSFLMIHDAWTDVFYANADALRKQADDLDVITSASVAAYMAHTNLTEKELRAKMKAETWITHEQALKWGFATSIEDANVNEKAAQSARAHLFAMLRKAMQAEGESDEDEDKPEKPDDDSDDKDDSDGEKGNPKPEKTPDDDPDDNEDEEQKNPDAPVQKWSGFFNALMN